MQASWGAENGAPGPQRGGKLFGEVGTEGLEGVLCA